MRTQPTRQHKAKGTPFNFDLKQMKKAVESKRTYAPKMNTFDDFEKWLES